MVWDSRRGRALLFGGDGAFSIPYASPWQFLRTPRPHWEPLVTTLDGPPLRSGMCAVYDSVGDRVLLFGGRQTYGDPGTNELWQLRLDGTPRWLQLQYASGPVPAARYDASMVLDRDRRLILFGGDGGGAQDGAVWILPLDAPALQWRELDEYVIGYGPGPRARHAAAYSAAASRMLVFGGEKYFRPDIGDFAGYEMCPPTTWMLSLAPFVQWVPALADTFEHPIAEVGGALVTDITERYAWLVPGEQGPNVNVPANWRYDFTLRQWRRGHPGFDGPGPRGGTACCLDRATGDVLVHGGAPHPSFYTGLSDIPVAETWALTAASLPGWVGLCRVPGMGDRPWYDVRAHFDAERRQLVTWTREGVWTCDVGGDATWHLEPAGFGNGPSLLNSMSTIDPVRRRLLVFGGEEGSHEPDADQVWSWPLDGPGPWSSTQITGPVPKGIRGTQCVFDVARDRVIVLPSESRYSAPSPLDTLPTIEFAGDAAQWTSLPITGSPPLPRSDGTVIMDPIHDRLILKGGRTSMTNDYENARDLWTLSLSGTPRWNLEISSRFEYEQASRCGLAVDPTLGRILLVGGVGLSYFDFGDRKPIHSTAFDDPLAWENLDPTSQSPMRGGGPLAFDAAENRMVWWNGRQLWQITWPLGSPVPYGAALVNADAEGVHIRWPGQPTGPYAADVDRSTDGGRTWHRLHSVTPESDGSLAFTDSAPAPSGAVYRATIERSGTTHVLGTASTVLGATTPVALTLVAPRPNPARDDVVIELGTPADGTVTIEVFDVTGRLAAPAMRRTIPAGSTVFTAPLARGLAPGLYMLRASDGRREVSARFVVVR